MLRNIAVILTIAAGSLAARPPNVIVILADDLGIMDIAAYAKKLGSIPADEVYHETPRLDALAREGLAFSQAYADQLCSPSRAALMSGRFASRSGFTTATPFTRTYYNQGLPVPEGRRPHDAFAHADKIAGSLAWNNGHSNTALPKNSPYLTKVLKSHDAAFTGKWHLGGHGAAGHRPQDYGFEELAWFDGGGSAYFNWRRGWDNRRPPNPEFPESERISGSSGKSAGKEYLTDELSAQVVRYLEGRAAQPDKPFFLHFCHFAVHTPIEGKPELVKHFKSKPQRGKHHHNNAVYAAMLKSLDDSVGAVIDTLRRTGLDKNTLVIFTSDNGGTEYTTPPATDNAPFKGGKANLHEGGIRVPMIVWGIGVKATGSWTDKVVHGIDILPTLAAVTGNPASAGIDGISMVPLLEDPGASWPERTLVWHYPFNVMVHDPSTGHPLTPHSGIRVGPHKLIFDWQGRLELYDIPADPFEKNDLAKEQPELAKKLFTQLKSWLRENVDAQYFPVLNPDYNPAQDPRQPFRDMWTN